MCYAAFPLVWPWHYTTQHGLEIYPREVTGAKRYIYYLLKSWYFVVPTRLGFQVYQVDTIMLVHEDLLLL